MTNRAESYKVIRTDDGAWYHATGSDFMFAFVSKDWPPTIQADVVAAFEAGLQVPSLIKQAVLDECGEQVVDGVYLQDQPSMTKAMNSIPGMALTSADTQSESGSGTATSINGAFFNAVLGGLGGNIDQMQNYLQSQMGDIQAQTGKSTVNDCFGTVIGMISLMPVLLIPVTTFQYLFSDQTTSEWFVEIHCVSHQEYSYNYQFTNLKYNYTIPAQV